MEIKSKEIKIVDIDSIIPNKLNNNKHNDKQKEQLKKIIKHQGFRSPLTVSNRSGFLIKGHLRLDAAKELGMTELPVIFQDYNNEADEYADLTADNAIAMQSEIDLSLINMQIADFGPELDIDLLGIKDFLIEPLEKIKEKEVDIKFEYKIEVDCGDEEQQNYLTGELNDRGFKVRVLI